MFLQSLVRYQILFRLSLGRQKSASACRHSFFIGILHLGMTSLAGFSLCVFSVLFLSLFCSYVPVHPALPGSWAGSCVPISLFVFAVLSSLTGKRTHQIYSEDVSAQLRIAFD